MQFLLSSEAIPLPPSWPLPPWPPFIENESFSVKYRKNIIREGKNRFPKKDFFSS